jgi:hypothetical protein
VLVQELIYDREKYLDDCFECAEVDQEDYEECVEFADEIDIHGFMQDEWKTVATFFTAKAAREYIKHARGEHNKLRTYVDYVQGQHELVAAMDAIGLKDAYERKMKEVTK